LRCQTRQDVFCGLKQSKPNGIRETRSRSQNYREAV
jgi:hypothetical protein